jgi:1,4-alpha-glucan branching enzyme
MKSERSDHIHRPDRYVVHKPPTERREMIASTKAITFRYTKPGAQQVLVVGTFNKWNPEANPMERLADGTFHTVIEIARGHHEFHFLVDGVAVTDRERGTIPDGNGGRRNVLEV